MKSEKEIIRKDVRKYFFSNRIPESWNSLRLDCVEGIEMFSEPDWTNTTTVAM